MDYDNYVKECMFYGFLNAMLTKEQFDRCVSAGLNHNEIYELSCDLYGYAFNLFDEALNYYTN